LNFRLNCSLYRALAFRQIDKVRLCVETASVTGRFGTIDLPGATVAPVRMQDAGFVGVLQIGFQDFVEYALARSTSPTLVAEYQTMLPSKALLRRKLHELYAQFAPEEAENTIRQLPKTRKRR